MAECAAPVRYRPRGPSWNSPGSRTGSWARRASRATRPASRRAPARYTTAPTTPPAMGATCWPASPPATAVAPRSAASRRPRSSSTAPTIRWCPSGQGEDVKNSIPGATHGRHRRHGPRRPRRGRAPGRPGRGRKRPPRGLTVQKASARRMRSSAASAKRHILASRSASPVSSVSAKSMAPETARQLCPGASP